MNRFVLAVAAVTALSGCQTYQPVTLTQYTQVTANSACPAGGVVISTGTDVDANGSLSADEIEKSYNVCNGVTPAAGKDGADGKNGVDGAMGAMGAQGMPGAPGKNAPIPLTATTLLTAGDVHCPSGGVRLDFGIDLGLDGGMGDGQLQASEVQATRYICNGTTPVYAQSASPPDGSVGTSTISANGGTSYVGNGGVGGTIDLEMLNGSLGGNVTVFATGAVDAGFAVPSPTFDPGPTAMHVTQNTTLRVFASPLEGLASNDAYFSSNADGRTYHRAADGGVDEVTGIDIEKNVTLTLTTAPFASMQLILRNDFRNAGTLRLDNGTAPRSVIRFYVAQFIGTRDSSVVGIDLNSGSGGMMFINTPRFVNEGSFVLRGQQNIVGGSGGLLLVQATALFNTGSIDVRGGPSIMSYGGQGGAVQFWASDLASRGSVLLSGGAGVSGGGAAGNALITSIGQRVRMGGSFTAQGGSCSGASCQPGLSGAVSVNVAGGEVFWSADVDCSGASGVSTGGAGGTFKLAAVSMSNGQAPKSLHVSGSINVAGGDGQIAGAGGVVKVTLDSGDFAEGAGLELLGYSALSVNGGNGLANGGSAGTISVLTAQSKRDGVVIGPTGAVVVSAPMTLVGGTGVNGGFGGTVLVGSNDTAGLGHSTEFVTTLSSIDARGGVGSGWSGGGGHVTVSSLGAIRNEGAVTLSGGGGSSDFGGSGGQFGVTTGHEVMNTGAVVLNGGSGRRGGGTAGQLTWSGGHVVNVGSLAMNGGDGAETGGSGAFSSMSSLVSQTENSGVISQHGGAGAKPGLPGSVYFDGVYLYR